MEVTVRNAIMPTSVGRRSQMAASDRAGAEIWSGSVEQVSSLMWCPQPASFVTGYGRGRNAPSESIPWLCLREASPTNRRGLITAVTSDLMTCARPLAFELSGRKNMACNQTAGAGLCSISTRVSPGRTVLTFVYRILVFLRVLPCEQLERRAILWRLCLTVSGLRKSASPTSPPRLHLFAAVVAWAVP